MSTKKEIKYITLQNTIKKGIESGLYPLGSKFPSNRELAKSFDASYVTIHNALIALEKDGYIKRYQGRGTFVTSTKANRQAIESNSCNVGYFVDVKVEFFGRFFYEIIQSTSANNLSNIPLRMLPATIDVTKNEHEKWFEEIFQKQYKSLVIYGDRHFPFNILKQYENHVQQINFVFFNDSAVEFKNSNQILLNLYEAGVLATNHLLEKKCKKIVLLGIRNLDSMYRRRVGLKYNDHETLVLDGIEEVLNKNNIDVFEDFKLLEGNNTTVENIIELINMGFTGFYGMNDCLVLKVYEAAKILNLTIGKDIFVIGTGNTPASELLSPKLTTLSMAEEEIGRATAELIKSNAKKMTILISPKLIIRESTFLKL